MRNYFFNALTRQSQYTHGFKNYVYVKIYIKINIIKIVCKEYMCVGPNDKSCINKEVNICVKFYIKINIIKKITKSLM